MGAMRAWSVAALVALLAGPARAQVSSVPFPVYIGTLGIPRTSGAIDRGTGEAVVTVKRDDWVLGVGSNGIYPAQEPLEIFVGDVTFDLPAGMLRPSRNGKVYSYRARGPVQRRTVRAFRIAARKDGSYRLRFTVAGADLYRLNIVDPVCQAVAVTIGDDHAFIGADFTSPSFTSRRLGVLPVACNLGGHNHGGS
jgi:hypothetical protein